MNAGRGSAGVDDVKVDGDSVDGDDEDQRFMVEGQRLIAPNRIGDDTEDSHDFDRTISMDSAMSGKRGVTFSAFRGCGGGSGH